MSFNKNYFLKQAGVFILPNSQNTGGKKSAEKTEEKLVSEKIWVEEEGNKRKMGKRRKKIEV